MLPSAPQLRAIADIITATGIPLSLLANAWIAYRQHKVKKLVNGRMEQLVYMARSDGFKEGALHAMAAQPSETPYIQAGEAVSEIKERLKRSAGPVGGA